jgi:hypothetical protein
MGKFSYEHISSAKERVRSEGLGELPCGHFTLFVFLYLCWLFVFIYLFQGFCRVSVWFRRLIFILIFFPLSVRKTEGVHWLACVSSILSSSPVR